MRYLLALLLLTGCAKAQYRRGYEAGCGQRRLLDAGVPVNAFKPWWQGQMIGFYECGPSEESCRSEDCQAKR